LGGSFADGLGQSSSRGSLGPDLVDRTVCSVLVWVAEVDERRGWLKLERA
jgi:hypothetical protein